MHEVFLQRLAAHPTLRNDHNFVVFLEYEGDVSNPSLDPRYTDQLCTITCVRQILLESYINPLS